MFRDHVAFPFSVRVVPDRVSTLDFGFLESRHLPKQPTVRYVHFVSILFIVVSLSPGCQFTT
jgi:hypothetical protein